MDILIPVVIVVLFVVAGRGFIVLLARLAGIGEDGGQE